MPSYQVPSPGTPEVSVAETVMTSNPRRTATAGREAWQQQIQHGVAQSVGADIEIESDSSKDDEDDDNYDEDSVYVPDDDEDEDDEDYDDDDNKG